MNNRHRRSKTWTASFTAIQLFHCLYDFVPFGVRWIQTNKERKSLSIVKRPSSDFKVQRMWTTIFNIYVPSAFQDAIGAGALTGQGINMRVRVCVCVHLKWRNDVEYQWLEFKSSPHFPCCRVLPTQTPMLGAQRYQISLSLSETLYQTKK